MLSIETSLKFCHLVQGSHEPFENNLELEVVQGQRVQPT